MNCKNNTLKKVAFCTLGCKVNQYETNAMEQKFINSGYKVVSFDKIADIYIINTCTVTNMSDKKSRQMLRRAKQLNEKAIIVAVGCYVQVGKKELEKIPEIDLILGNNEKIDIVEYVESYIIDKNVKNDVTDVMHQAQFLDFGTVTYSEKTRAVIKIQDGCDRFCSYCIIPYARGRVRSRLPESIINEVKAIVETGIREVVITGIHIASYGKDLKNEIRLIDILEQLDEINGLERIRLGSLEPTLITEEFVQRLKKLKKICNHFHLSLQSACNETLNRMNRKYTIEQFKESVKILRKNYEDVALTTDIIVGFPGETEQEFNETLENLRKINFYKMHVFKYSKRKGTKAAEMPNQIDSQIQDKRSKELLELSNENQKDFNRNYIGKRVDVLFEEKDGIYIKGHTSNYIMVKVPLQKKNEELENVIKQIEITDIENEELIGKVIEKL